MNKLILSILLSGLTVFSYATSITASGTLSGNTTWSADTVNVVGTITINSNINLNINPGTRIIFHGFYKIETYGGSIKAIGNVNDSIYFTAFDTVGHYTINTPAGGWNGIHINFGNPVIGDSCIFSHCRIEYAKQTLNNSSGYCVTVYNRSNVRFSNCTVTHNNFLMGCGGIAGAFGGVTVTECVITQNISDFGGAIFAVQDFSVYLRGNLITYNYADRAGGGIMINDSPSLVIINNKICNNRTRANNCGPADGGGGMRIDGSAGYIANNLIANNSTGMFGGGINLSYSSTPLMENNTVVNNNATYSGGGIYLFQSNPVLRNNIFWGNTRFNNLLPNQVMVYTENSDPPFYNNCVQDDTLGFHLASGITFTGYYINNLDTNPQFVAPATGSGYTYDALNADWSLQTGSPCINGGTTFGIGNIPLVDLAYNARIVGWTIDIGAYEDPTPLSIAGTIDNVSTLIYPNPTGGIVSVLSESGEDFTYVLTDLHQREIQKGNSVDMSINLDLSAQESGIYLLHILRSNGSLETHRIVRN